MKSVCDKALAVVLGEMCSDSFLLRLDQPGLQQCEINCETFAEQIV